MSLEKIRREECDLFYVGGYTFGQYGNEIHVVRVHGNAQTGEIEKCGRYPFSFPADAEEVDYSAYRYAENETQPWFEQLTAFQKEEVKQHGAGIL